MSNFWSYVLSLQGMLESSGEWWFFLFCMQFIWWDSNPLVCLILYEQFSSISSIFRLCCLGLSHLHIIWEFGALVARYFILYFSEPLVCFLLSLLAVSWKLCWIICKIMGNFLWISVSLDSPNIPWLPVATFLFILVKNTSFFEVSLPTLNTVYLHGWCYC